MLGTIQSLAQILTLLFCVNGRVWKGLCLIPSVRRFKRYHTIVRAIVRSQNALNATGVDCSAIQRPIVTNLEHVHFCGSSANSFLHDRRRATQDGNLLFELRASFSLAQMDESGTQFQGYIPGVLVYIVPSMLVCQARAYFGIRPLG
jgi:hypothetical protein